MKRILALVLSVFLLTGSAFAAEIDFASMSLDELITMRNNAEDEICNRVMGDLSLLYPGVYVVGKDVKEGKYLIACADLEVDENDINILWYDEEEDYEKSRAEDVDYLEPEEPIFRKLVSGMVFATYDGTISLLPAEGMSYMP